MKTDRVIAIILAFSLFVILVFRYYTEKVSYLENKLKDKETATVYVQGKTDTVYKHDTVKIVIRVPIPEGGTLDTTIEKSLHRMHLIASKEKIALDVKCMKPETIITRIDTIKLKEIKYIDKIVPDTSIHWNEYLYGVGTGVIAALITYIAIK